MKILHALRFSRVAAALILTRSISLHDGKLNIRGERLAAALETLGPSFIKLGQALSTRADLLGTDAAEALSHLRDKLPPFPAATARQILEEELGKPLSTVFLSFDDVPVAAASVAQVHKATLLDGREVAVKILRPGIQRVFKKDIAFFYAIARMLEKRRPQLRRLKPLAVVELLEKTARFELDLRFEAAAIGEMREKCADMPYLRLPQVELPLTSERVMVMEWIHGLGIHQVVALKKAGHDVDAILTHFSEMFFRQAIEHGFFHADLHPGNVLIDTQGRIALIDFGIMGRLSARERRFIAEIFRGFLTRDYAHVARVHFRAGYVPSTQNVEEFTLAARAIAEPILDRPAHEISMARLLAQLFRVTEAFQMETQPQLLLLQKSLVVVEGVGRMLNPAVNMWEMARQPIEAWALRHYSPKTKVKEAMHFARELAEDMPEIVEKFLKAVKN